MASSSILLLAEQIRLRLFVHSSHGNVPEFLPQQGMRLEKIPTHQYGCSYTADANRDLGTVAQQRLCEKQHRSEGMEGHEYQHHQYQILRCRELLS